MTVPVIVALDCSTSACKAVVFDLSGETVCESRRYVTTTSPRPGWYEQDATQWAEGLADALTSVADLLPPSHRPLALGITHQRETFVCVDRDHHPIRPAILWLDNRAEEQVARLGGDAVQAATGKPRSTLPSLYKLAWLAEHEPDTLRRTHQVLDVHAYVSHYLTGVAVTSWASADSTALVDLATRDWSPELLRAAGLTRQQVPELAAPGDRIGGLRPEVARRTGLPVGLPVVAGAGDGQCAGIGVGGLAPGTAYLNLGTSFSLGAFVPGRPTYPGLRTMAAPVPGHSAVETLQPVGGMTLDWARDLLSAPDRSAVEAAAAEVPPGAGGLLFLPYLGGRETPVHRSDVRGAVLGLGGRHGAAELLRAVVEGLAHDQRDCLDLLRQATGADLRRVIVTGGFAQSALVVRIFSDVLGVPTAVAPEREGTALGAAVVAAAAGPDAPYADVPTAARHMTRPAATVAVDAHAAEYHEAVRPLRAGVLAGFDATEHALTALRHL
ncbi:xylulokinase [Micromonospora pallida]|uniref:Xylulokinase n=1 Tax=Micromonospora pallida TaxID=145854 RepID=A0A1C6RWT1_9ACTN|nr:FGGY family carbohydrate kinase [Micromonospora pallida]SCL21672.1 xylulokinase [Micromonospora pallida]